MYLNGTNHGMLSYRHLMKCISIYLIGVGCHPQVGFFLIYLFFYVWGGGVLLVKSAMHLHRDVSFYHKGLCKNI